MNSKNKKNKVIVVWGVIFLGVLLIGMFMRGAGTRKWHGVERAIVIDRDLNTIKSFDPSSEMGVEIVLPNSMIIKTMEGRGEWKLEVMVELAKKFGRKWAVDSIGSSLGLYICCDEANMGWVDKMTWGWKTKDVKWDKIALGDTSLTKELIAKDNETEVILGPEWDRWVGQNLYSEIYLHEGLKVTVENSLGVPGMGTLVARVLNNMGLRVVEVKSGEGKGENVDRCVVEVNPKYKKAVTLLMIKDYLNCSVGEKGDDSMVVVKLGRDFEERWLGK